eukprot:3068304-Rhodomonas_salina.1
MAHPSRPRAHGRDIARCIAAKEREIPYRTKELTVSPYYGPYYYCIQRQLAYPSLFVLQIPLLPVTPGQEVVPGVPRVPRVPGYPGTRVPGVPSGDNERSSVGLARLKLNKRTGARGRK